MVDLITIGITGIVIAFLMAGGYFYLMGRKYPVRVIIMADRAGKGVREEHDKAGRMRFKKTGREFYKLKKRKRILPAINYNDLIPSPKGVTLYLHSANPEDYTPMHVEDRKRVKAGEEILSGFTPIEVEAIDERTEEGKAFVIQKDREIARKMAYTQTINDLYVKFIYKTNFEKFMPIILLMVFALSIAIIMIAASQGIAENVGQLSGAVTQLAELSAEGSQAFTQGVQPPI